MLGSKKKNPADGHSKGTTTHAAGHTTAARQPAKSPLPPTLVFHCQLAHGSPTGIITGFTNVRELYQQIAKCYDINPSQILFCTLNTHKVDVSHLLAGTLGLDDFIFAHVRGQPKVVELEKSEDALGLTITDNGAGLVYIKGVKKESILGSISGVYVGDHIEKLDEQSVIGCRHYEVAKLLKEIPNGKKFTLRLIEPLKTGFSEIGNKSSTVGGHRNKGGLGSGKETLRLRAKGPATVEVPDGVEKRAVERINELLEGFLGISDTELAQSIWEVGSQKKNPSDFALAVKESDLREFGFTDAFVFDLWGAITDANQGRLGNMPHEFNENF